MDREDDHDNSANDALMGWGRRKLDCTIEARRGSDNDPVATYEFQEAKLRTVLDMRRSAVNDDLEEYTLKQDLLASERLFDDHEEHNLVAHASADGVTTAEEIQALRTRLLADLNYIGLTLLKIRRKMTWRYALSGSLNATSIYVLLNLRMSRSVVIDSKAISIALIRSSNGQLQEYAAFVMIASTAYTAYGVFGLLCVQLCQRRRTKLMRTLQMNTQTDSSDNEVICGWSWEAVKCYDIL